MFCTWGKLKPIFGFNLLILNVSQLSTYCPSFMETLYFVNNKNVLFLKIFYLHESAKILLSTSVMQLISCYKLLCGTILIALMLKIVASRDKCC